MQLEIAKKSYLKKNVTVEPIEQKVFLFRKQINKISAKINVYHKL